MSSGGKRRSRALAVLIVLAVVGPALVGLVAPRAHGAAREPGAQMASDSRGREGAVQCAGDLASGPTPVLLVHGTALTAAENWSTSYLPALLLEGRGVCTVSLPGVAVGDLQHSIEYVATAIREVHVRAGRRLAVLGHSQGASLPRIALRVWPDLAAKVDDVIGLAGVYDDGSAELTARCAERCVPAMRQLAAGSRLLGAVARRSLPAGPSYTNIGTLGDTTVTPQPAANRQRGATAIQVQDVCPGRVIPLSEHGLILGDAVAKALVDDALDHRGAASADRVPRSTCAEVYYVGFVPNPFLEAAPFVRERLRPTTTSEPALRCHLRPTCADADARGRLLEQPVVTVTRRAVTWRGRVPLDGLVRVRQRGTAATAATAATAVVRRVRPGGLTLRVRRPDARRGALVLETRPDRYTAWAREGVVRLR